MRISWTIGAILSLALACTKATDAKETSNDTPTVNSLDPDVQEKATDTTGPAGKKDPPKILDYRHFAKAVIDEQCVSCHGSPPSGGAPPTFDLSSFEDTDGLNLLTINGIRTMAATMAVRVKDDTMPPGGWKGDRTERDFFIKWLDEGAPEGTETTDVPPEESTAPKVSFTSPTNLNQPATGNQFTVTVAFAGAGTAATYDLFWTETADATTGGHAVVSGRPVAQTAYTWDLSGLSNGAYFVYTVLHTGGKDYSVASAGSVRKSPPESVNHSPRLTLSTPFKLGDSQTLKSSSTDLGYTATDADGDAMTFVFEISVNGGASWSTFTCSSVTNNGCTWNTAGLTEGIRYRVRITADDAHGGVTTAASTKDFGVATTTYSYNDYLAGLLAAHCDSCHAGGAFGGFDSSSYPTVFALASRIVVRASTEGSMPAAGALPTSDRTKLQLWYWQSAPEGTPPVPTIAVTNPSSANSPTTGGQYTVQVSVAHAANGATYDLYATAGQGATTGGQQIVVGRLVTSPSYLWDPSALANGAYFVYAVLHSGGQTYTGNSAGSVLKNTPTNHNPTIQLSGALYTGDTAIIANGATSISYTAADSDGDTLTYAFEYSADGGSSWTTFTCGSITAAGCSWNTSGLAEGVNYKLRVSLDDGVGGTASDASQAAFGIASAAYTYANFLGSLLSNNCDSCHSGGAFGFTSSSLAGAQAKADRIVLRASVLGTMPQGGPLSGSDRTRIQLWFWQGTI